VDGGCENPDTSPSSILQHYRLYSGIKGTGAGPLLIDATVELRDYVLVLRSRLGTVIVVTLLGFAVAVALTVLSTPKYHAEAKVLVLPLANPLTSSSSAIQALAPGMDTEREVVRAAEAE